jgi:hypothetical protein
MQKVLLAMNVSLPCRNGDFSGLSQHVARCNSLKAVFYSTRIPSMNIEHLRAYSQNVSLA